MDETPRDDETPGVGPAWEPGTLIGRRYALERQLGRGSNGNVWLAKDQLLDKSVALKVLDPELAKNRDTVRRFLREVALAHAVTHPHVVRIYDTGEQDGLPYFTMEYIKGQTLEERIDGDEGRLDFKALRRIALQVLDGLESAHQVGVIHRDLKPGNVMLTHRGAIVLDFGVAGIEEAPKGDPSASSIMGLVRTEAGTIFGSPAYMAPELWEGESASVRSDLFAFGVMLYQMITGRLPWTAKTPAGYLQLLATTPPPPIRALRRDTPWPLLRLCMRCLSTDRAHRPGSAAAAIDLLSPLRSVGRRRLAFAGVAAAGVLAAFAWARAPWALRATGLPDQQTRTDLDAAVRMFDAGDDAAALRLIERLSAQAPNSATLVFWRAAVYHSLGDASGRAAACRTEGPLEGSAQWLRRAKAACAETFGTGTSDPQRAGDLLPLWVETALVPRSARGEDTAEQARDVLALLEREDANPLLPNRAQQARVHLEITLGRTDEAQQHLSDLVDAAPRIPLFAARLAWLASRRGQDERAATLASRVRAVDPTPALALQMDAGRMREAWEGIEALGEEHPHAPALVELWCTMAWRYGAQDPPAQCRAAHEGFAHALWSEQPDGLAGTLADPCPEVGDVSTVLTVAPWGLETVLTEAALRGALCRAGDGDPQALGGAREHASRLLAATPDSPWALLLAADVAERSGDAPLANAHRLEAVQRWRDADPDLPVVGALRTRVQGPPAGPRTAEHER
ncbi:MAG: protein kinase domain-containing protein [Nannocystaceae bacterium]|nr:protein kinase [bacterium]